MINVINTLLLLCAWSFESFETTDFQAEGQSIISCPDVKIIKALVNSAGGHKSFGGFHKSSFQKISFRLCSKRAGREEGAQ